MSHFKCPKCCGKSVQAGSIGCSYCNINSNKGVEMCDNSQPEQPEVAVQRETDAASVSRNYMLPNSMPLDLTVKKRTRERDRANSQTMQKVGQELRGKKQSMPEISKKTERNRDFIPEKSAATNRIPSGNRHSVDIRKELPIPNSQFSSALDSSSYFEMSGGSRNQSAPNDIVSSFHTQDRKRRVSNNRQTSGSSIDDKRSKPETSTESGKYISSDSRQDANNDDALELNYKSQITVDNSALDSNNDQNNESHSITSETVEDCEPPTKISSPVASDRGSVFSVDDGLAISGPSGLTESKSDWNLCGETFQSFTCMVCKEAIADHATEENTFKCCICSYPYCEEVDLQIHSFTYVAEITCSICGKKHTAGNSHNSQHRCLVPDCKMTFYCRTKLYEHFLDHPDYLFKHCWVCRRKFKEHEETEKDSSYVCCVCGRHSKGHNGFKTHYALHLPRFYCEFCKEEYSKGEKGLHGTRSEFTCSECLEEFKCQTQLEVHNKEEHKNRFKNCIICRRSIDEHLIGPAEGERFQCCKKECLEICILKINLQDHLYEHTKLRDFKCPACGRRFHSNSSQVKHSRFCEALNFKCELCEIRFHSSDILRKHFLVKYKQA